MPRFEVRLESTDHFQDDGTPHFRVTRLDADTPEAAREYCQEHEFKLVGFRIPAERLAELQAVIDDHPRGVLGLKGTDRGHYVIHHQTVPYQVVSVAEVEGR